MKKTILAIILSTFYFLLSSSTTLAHEADQCGLPDSASNSMMSFGMMGWPMTGSSSAWGWSGSVMMILFWLLIILAIWAVIKWISSQASDTSNPQRSKPALDILKERFAKGEINKKEFEEIKKDLIEK